MRLRHHKAILQAAGELVTESDGARFTADELAERAGVSRRTVFNHFASLDDVVLGMCTELLDVVTERLRTQVGRAPTADVGAGGHSREVMFTALAQALQSADLSGPIIQVWRALGGTSADAQRQEEFAQRALALVADDLAVQLAAANPTADPLDIDLLASLLTHGIGVIAGHWLASVEPGQSPDPARWAHLLDRLLHTVGSGYLATTYDGVPAGDGREGDDDG